MDDRDLLSRYVETRDEAAFTELVRGHFDFVYAAALRQVGGDAHLAQDVAQEVFAALAQKAPALVNHPVLKAWLLTGTRFAAAKTVRRERLRATRESNADLMGTEERANNWNDIRPALDELLAGLNPAERDAVLLRYFEDRGFADIGARMRISEDAARMRVDRALERLRGRLARRGIVSTVTAIGAQLTMQAGVTAPAGMATSVAHAALMSAAAAPTASLIQVLMGTKTTLGAVALLGVAALICVPGIGVAVHEWRAAVAADAEIAEARREQAAQIGQLQHLLAQAGHNAERIADIQHLLEQAKTAAQATPSSPRHPVNPAAADGAAFLAAFPDVRERLLSSGKLRTDPKLLAILRQAGMSDEQIEAFNTRMWRERIESLQATPDLGLGWNVSGLPSPDELRPLIGQAGIDAITRWTKMAEVNNAAAGVAADVAISATPLSPAQVEELTQAMYTVKPSAALAPGSADWNAAFGALQAQLTPEQRTAVDKAVARVGFPVLLNYLERQSIAGAANQPVKQDTTP